MSISVNRSEWVWFIVVTTIVMLFSSFPYLGAYRAETATEFFNGAVYDRLDFSGYLATMRRGAAGDWHYELPFTSEPQTGVYMRLPYIVLGHLSRWLRISLVGAYHLARLGLSLTTCIGLYLLAAFTFENVFSRRVSFLLAVAGSGLGWLQLIFGWVPQVDISPIDYWLISAYPFFGLITFPHFAAMLTFLVGQIALFLSYLRRPSFWKLFFVILFGISIQPLNPYLLLLGDIALLGAVVVQGVQKWQRVPRFRGNILSSLRCFKLYPLFIIALSQLPWLVYSFYIVRSDPIWQGFTSQALTLSPPPLYLFWGFGLLWVFAIIGVWTIFRHEFTLSFGAALLWLVSAVLLSYAPVVFQRRFLFGITIPLGILGTEGISKSILPWLERVLSKRFAHHGKSIIWFVVALTMISSFYLSLGGALYASTRPPELFDTKEMIAAADWLLQNATADDVLLTSEATGRMFAQRTGLTVYIGHPIETLDYKNKSKLVDAFFSGEAGLNQLPACGCQWLIYGPAEKDLGTIFAEQDRLSVAYRNQEYVIFRIEP